VRTPRRALRHFQSTLALQVHNPCRIESVLRGRSQGEPWLTPSAAIRCGGEHREWYGYDVDNHGPSFVQMKCVRLPPYTQAVSACSCCSALLCHCRRGRLRAWRIGSECPRRADGERLGRLGPARNHRAWKLVAILQRRSEALVTRNKCVRGGGGCRGWEMRADDGRQRVQ
jgi:hypothetical protein